VHAVVERAHVQPEEWVAVIGPGTIGLLAAQVAQAIGARVTLAGLARHSDRFRLGQELGIASVIQLNHPGDVEAMRDAAREEGSFGVDVVVDCSGAPEGLMDSLRLVRKGGRVVLVGFYGKPLEIDADKIINAELSLIASRGKRPSSFRIALDLLRDRRVNTSKLVTHRFALAAWQDALAVAGRSGTKVVFDDMIA
jgi:2-desacetyl-2-hydroxyethyl bacteriochlorophyllide A dehydrogenase